MPSTTSCVTPSAKQIWTSSGVLISIIGQGMMTGYPSCLLHALRAPDSPIKTDIHSASWIVSATGIAIMFGNVSGSLLMDWGGRKKAFILANIPVVVSWLLIYFASDVPVLIVARFLSGVTGGATGIIAVVALGEYNNPKIRGIFLILKTTALYFGSLIVHLIGNCFHWRTVALISMIPNLTALVIVCTWRESPVWLATKKQFGKCEREFYWLRGDSEEAVREFKEFIDAQKERLSVSVEKVTCFGTIWEIVKKFSRKDFLKPLLIMLLGSLLVESSGRHIFPAYAKQIIGDISTNESHAFYINLCFDLIFCISTTVASILIKYVNRRTLLFSTGVPALVVLFSVCLYLVWSSTNTVTNTSWLPIVGFVIFFILSNLGCSVIPFILLGEIFPLLHKGAGVMTVGVIWPIFIMLGLKITPYMLVSIKLHGTFTVLGSIMGVSLLLLYFLQPETKDRTLQQIEDIVSQRVRRGSKNRKDEGVTVHMIQS